MVGPFLSKHQAPPQENAWAWNRRPLPVPQKLLQAWGACWPWWSDFHVINADGQNFVHYLHPYTASSPILLQHRPNNLFHPMTGVFISSKNRISTIETLGMLSGGEWFLSIEDWPYYVSHILFHWWTEAKSHFKDDFDNDNDNDNERN